MKLAFDIDGVLADLITPLLEFHNEEYGTDLSPEAVDAYDLAEAWECSDEEHRRRIEEFQNTSAYAELEPLEDAKGVLDILDQQHRLYVLTARRPELVREATTEWVRETFPDRFEDVLFTGSSEESKAQLCDENDIKILVDDNPRHIRPCREYDVTGVLFSQPWNDADDVQERTPRVHNWSQVLQFVQNVAMFSNA